MLEKLAAVIGTSKPISDWGQVDPDPSYVITWDNLLKMLAILMRLRSVEARSAHATTTSKWHKSQTFSDFLTRRTDHTVCGM